MNISPTLTLLSQALDASLMRQQAIAHNIANVQSIHPKTLRVNFEEQFPTLDALQLQPPSEIRPFYEQIQSPPKLDEQIALNVQNITQFRALIKGLNHQFALMNLAISGGN